MANSAIKPLESSLVTTPLSIGDIVGRSLRIFRVNWKLIALTLLPPTIFLCLARVALSVAAQFMVKGTTLTAASVGSALTLLAAFLIMVVASFNLYLRELCLVRMFCGLAATFEQAHSFVKDRFWTLIAVALVWFVLCMILFIFCAVELVLSGVLLNMKGIMPYLGSFGIAVGIIGFIAVVLFSSILAMLYISSMALENLSAGAAAGHCFNLGRRAFWRSILFLVLSHTTVSFLAYPLCVPIFVLMIVVVISQGITTGSHHTELPIYYQVLSQVWETLITMVLGPINYICYGLYFCDLRMRQEGTDILQRLEKLQLPPERSDSGNDRDLDRGNGPAHGQTYNQDQNGGRINLDSKTDSESDSDSDSGGSYKPALT